MVSEGYSSAIDLCFRLYLLLSYQIYHYHCMVRWDKIEVGVSSKVIINRFLADLILFFFGPKVASCTKNMANQPKILRFIKVFKKWSGKSVLPHMKVTKGTRY